MSAPKKILIIDNDLVIRYTLKKIFSNYLTSNLKIYTSSDGLQGLGYVYVVRPDLIIIDTTLPKYSGRELTEYIRTNQTLSNTPVILLNEDNEFITGLPENFSQISKTDKNFPNNLVEVITKLLAQEISLTIRPGYKLTNFLSKKILRYSNISDVESQKVLSKNIFVKSAYYLKYLFDQFLTSVYLTFFYIFVGKKDYEETVDQKQKDVERFRVKTFPALAFGLAVVFFGILQVLMLSGVFVALTYVATAPAYAASYTWDGGGSDGTCGGNAGDGNKWSCAANWSSDIVPTAADSVTFNSTSTKDATIDASFGGTVTSLTIATGYSGTITVSRSFTISSTYSQAAGTFNGGSQTIAITGAFSLSAGTFTSTSGNMSLDAGFQISGTGVFNHNNGTVTFGGNGGGNIRCNFKTFNSVVLNIGTTGKSIFDDCNLPIGNNPTVNRVELYGTLTGTGTITSNAGSLGLQATSVLSGFTGMSVSVLNVQAGTTVNFGSYTTFTNTNGVNLATGSTFTLPSGASMSALTITAATFNAPSGNMNITGALTISGASTFNHNNGTITFNGSTATLSCNNVTFNLVSFTGQTNTKTVNSNCTLPLGNNPTIPQALILNGTIGGTGTLTTGGGFTVYTGSSMTGFSGFTNATGFVIAGATIDFSTYSPVTLNGTFTLSSGSFKAPTGTLVVNAGLTFTGGTFDANGGLVDFSGGTTSLSCNNVTFNSVTFAGWTNLKTLTNCNLPLGNNPTIAPLTMNTSTLTGTGTLTAASSLTINSGTTPLSGFSAITIAQGFVVAGATVDLSSYTSFIANNNVTLSSGTLTLPNGADLNGTLTISGGTFNAPSGVMTLASNLTISGSPTFNHNNGTITFDGTGGGTLTCNNVAFNLVTFAHSVLQSRNISSGCTIPLGNNPIIPGGIALTGTITGTGLLTMSTSTTLSMNAGAVISGFSSLAGSLLTISGATVDFSSYSAFTLGSNLTVSSGTVTLPNNAAITHIVQSNGTFNSGANMTLAGGLTLSGGTFNAPTGTMTIVGALTVTNSPTFNHNNGIITFNGVASVTLSCNNITFNKVNFSHTSGIKTVNSNCTFPLGNNPTLGSGSAAITSSGLFTGTGTLTTTPGAFIVQNGGNFTGFTGLVTIGAFATIATTASTNINLDSYTTVDFNNNLSVNTPTAPYTNTFTAPSGNMNIGGFFVFGTGSTYNHNNGKIIIDGAAIGYIQCNGQTLNRVDIGDIGADKLIYANCNLPLGNNPVIGTGNSAGRFTLYGGSITGTGLLTSNTDFVIGGVSSLTSASGFTEFNFKKFLEMGSTTANFSGINKVSIGTLNVYGAPASFTAPQNLYISLDTSFWTAGGFHHNNGKVILNGNNQTFIVGINNPFYDLEKINTNASTLLIPATSSYSITVSHNLTLKGAASNLLSLRSGTPGSQWNISTANIDISYLDVQDSNNTGISVIQAGGKNITNSGNNTRWNFDNPSITNVGPIYLTNGSNISNNKPSYTFNITDPQASDTVKYQIQIDNNSDFTSPEIDYTSTLAAQGSQTFTPTTALPDSSYYVRIKGIDSTGGDGGYSTVNGNSPAFTMDTTKPTGSVLYAYKTDSTSREIYLIMSATDNLSGVDKMMISENSNFANSSFEEYKTSKAYTISDGYGSKTIYVKFRDRAGNESTTYVVTPNYSQVIVTPSTTPGITQVPVSYGVPIGGNLTDGLSVLALRVIGKTNNPLANVSINIPQLGITTTTDENGLIVLQNVPLGSYDVLGLFNNKEFNQNLDVSGDQSVITIKLEDTPNTLTVIFGIMTIISIIIITLIILVYFRRKINKK